MESVDADKAILLKGGKHAFAKPPRGPSPEMRKDSVINSLKNAAVGRTVSYSDDEYTDDE